MRHHLAPPLEHLFLEYTFEEHGKTKSCSDLYDKVQNLQTHRRRTPFLAVLHNYISMNMELLCARE